MSGSQGKLSREFVLTTLLVPQGMTKITMHFPYQR